MGIRTYANVGATGVISTSQRHPKASLHASVGVKASTKLGGTRNHAPIKVGATGISKASVQTDGTKKSSSTRASKKAPSKSVQSDDDDPESADEKKEEQGIFMAVMNLSSRILIAVLIGDDVFLISVQLCSYVHVHVRTILQDRYWVLIVILIGDNFIVILL